MAELQEEISEYFFFLDELRLSGVTNMFGAGKWLEVDYNMKPKNARKVLSAWMKTFDVEATVDERVEEAIKEGLV